jgi:hypothetical protein
MELNPETVARHHPAVQWSRLGDELVLLDPSGRMLRGLNGTGARVWELIDSARTARSIAEVVAVEYRSPRERVLADVLAFLSKLADTSLVELGPGASATNGGIR